VGGEVLPDEFGTEPLLGYRGWQIVDVGDGTGPALKSLHVHYIWSRTAEAFCHQQAAPFLKGRHPGTLSPDPACSCGIYAQLPEHPLTAWDEAKQGIVSASGTIAMWGRVIQCERGYKAQFAEIQEPLVLDFTCVKGCEATPTRIALPENSQVPFFAYCPDHARSAAELVTIEAGIWLREMCTELSARYEIEFLTWI
jgi:hypothetical protein